MKKILKKINEIDNKIDSLEQYFKNRSGSIFTNDEFNYCTNKLGWKTINSSDTINISQWSGTRVDIIFFANFQKIPEHYQYLLFMKGSDHLPLLIDIKIDDTDISKYLNITQINENKISAALPSVELIPQHSRLTSECANYAPLRQIYDYDEMFKNNTPLYNSQPCTDISFDWVINNTFTKVSDPYIIAGTQSQTLGRLGTYLTTDISYTMEVIRKIMSGNLANL